MTDAERRMKLFTRLVEKGTLKQKVFQQTYESFLMIKDVLREMSEEYEKSEFNNELDIPVEFSEKGQFEVQIKFAGDILVFMMHTNVFTFEEGHEIYSKPYVQEEECRAYFGMIQIYNLLI